MVILYRGMAAWLKVLAEYLKPQPPPPPSPPSSTKFFWLEHFFLTLQRKLAGGKLQKGNEVGIFNILYLPIAKIYLSI